MRPPRGAGAKPFSRRVGGVRPSQLMYAYGVGALIDLPNFSVLVGGLDDWEHPELQEVVVEDRLLAVVRAELGDQATQLRSAPWEAETRNVFDRWASVGVPVLPFPRWLRCTRCNYLGPCDNGMFELETNAFRPDWARWAHRCATSGRSPLAIPARFVVACGQGHLDEFPWVEFAHKDTGGACAGSAVMESIDVGSGRATGVMVRCRTCAAKTFLTQAFGAGSDKVLPRCRGREPHLRRFDPAGCQEQTTALLLGASNAWFAVTRSVLALPLGGSAVEEVVRDLWPLLDDPAAPVDSADKVSLVVNLVPGLHPLKAFDLEAVWAAIEARRAGRGPAQPATPDLLGPEWEVFAQGNQTTTDWKTVEKRPPVGRSGYCGPTLCVERLREVVALVGFTRIDGPDSGVATDAGAPRLAPLARVAPTWVPASQTRGEGILVRLDEDRLAAWEAAVAGKARTDGLVDAHERWRTRRGLDPSTGWPGLRFVVLHSLAHALINELALECGYSAASIRERIYAREPSSGVTPMAGILLYTAAPDSEGTLGGLVALGEPQRLGEVIARALGRVAICASDPMCADHIPDEGEDALHGAACHACLFVPETSCGVGNRYLERATLVPTLAGAGIEYFSGPR